MVQTVDTIWRDYQTDGVPSSGAHQPIKRDIRELLGEMEFAIDAFLNNGGKVYQTLALLNGDLTADANVMAWVLNDATIGNNGIYQKVGAAGVGSWTRVANLPYTFIKATDAGAGTANAITAESPLPIFDNCLVAFNVFEDNTASPVTIRFNGGTILTIKTPNGANIEAGALLAGMALLGLQQGSTFRLLSDPASAGSAAAAEAAAAAAEAAAALAIDAADQAAVEGAGDVPVMPTRAFAIAATIPTARTYILLAGYSAVGDGGKALYKKVVSEPAHPGKFQSADGAWWELSEQVVNVHMFGAVGDGSTDDHDAIIRGNDYCYTRKSVLEFHHKIYVTSPLTVGGVDIDGDLPGMGDKLCTWRGLSYDGRGDTDLQAIIRLKSGSNTHLLTVQHGGGQYNFEQLHFDGNVSGQTSGGGFCVFLQDQPSPVLGTEYNQAPWFTRCWFRLGRGGGIWIGENRNNGRLIDCAINGCGHASLTGYGIYMDCYDWVLSRCNINQNINSVGVLIYRGSGLHIEHCNISLNALTALQIGPSCIDVTYIGGSIDQNAQYGILVSKNTVLGVAGTTYGARTFVGVRFYGNGSGAASTYSDVYVVDDDTQLTFVGCHFDGQPAFGVLGGNAVVNHLHFAHGSARCRMVGNSFTSGLSVTNAISCLSTTAHGSIVVNDSTNVWGGGNLLISGEGYKPVGTAWVVTSDARIKNVLGDYTLGLDTIKQLVPKRYTYKGNNTSGPLDPTKEAAPYDGSSHYDLAVSAKEHVGLIAQEVETVLPGMVSQTMGYIDGVQVSDQRLLHIDEMYYVMVNAIKELAARVEQLETAPPP